MGLEAITRILNSIVHGIWSGITSVTEGLVIAGFILIFLIAGVYLALGLLKLGRAILNLRIHQFTMLILGIGFALLAIAAIVP